MNKVIAFLGTAFLFLALAGCEGRSDKTDGDSIIVTLDVSSEIIRIGESVNAMAGPAPLETPEEGCIGNGYLCLQEVTIRSENKPTGNGVTPGVLSLFELDYIEIKYERVDLGSRLPPPLVRAYAGGAASSHTIGNLPIFSPEQTFNEPLSDLLYQNGGIDRETGEPRIKLNIILRAFGRTLGGDDVESRPMRLTFDLVQ
jgi:hypothetical protein